MSISINVSPEFKCLCPAFRGVALMADVKNPATPPGLWAEIEAECNKLMAAFTTETIKNRSGIEATRAAYKTLGKDPSRYRPACEQLARRVVQGKGLYSVDTLVDAINLVSLFSGYSTAALDMDKIRGGLLTLGIGREGEPYEGIGRGVLNIDRLPVYRDEAGGVATPTSDNVRTMISAETHRLLVLINGYDGDAANLDAAAALTERLLAEYAAGKNFQRIHYPQ